MLKSYRKELCAITSDYGSEHLPKNLAVLTSNRLLKISNYYY